MTTTEILAREAVTAWLTLQSAQAAHEAGSLHDWYEIDTLKTKHAHAMLALAKHMEFKT